MNLLEAFKDNWTDKGFSKPGQTILLAVSGGIDSMTMVHLFHSSHLPFAIAHCNYQLRGDESDKDEVLVREWAFHNNVPFHHTRFATKQKMEEWKKGVQETTRILRYEWFEALREEFGYSLIATAHQANDNAETLLMNLCKGTGLGGLHAIPERNDKIIRPLLFASRKDIERYVKENNISYRDDASNATDNYLRNEVRHHIIPAIEGVFPDAIRQMSNSIERFAAAELIYKKAIEVQKKRLLDKRGNDYYIPILKLQKQEALPAIFYELFIPFGFSPAQLPQINALLNAESGHYVSSATHKVIRNRDFLIITTVDTATTDIIHVEAVPCRVTTDHGSFSCEVMDMPVKIPASDSIACIDTNQLSFPLILRKWKTGDYFYPLGMGMKKKKLSKFFIDNKVPLHERKKYGCWNQASV